MLTSHVGVRTATALVIANVIGAGVFTTTGFQAADLGNPYLILFLWAVGGVLAWCGAMCFGELGAAMPAAGAEYVYLRETYGRAFGFMSAFVSLFAGFSAPIAAASKAVVLYLGAWFPALAEEPQLLAGISVNDLIAVGLVWLLVTIHSRETKGAFAFNNAVTLLKVGGIVLIIIAATLVGEGDLQNFSYVSEHYNEMSRTQLFTALSTSLIFVMFCGNSQLSWKHSGLS